MALRHTSLLTCTNISALSNRFISA
jgi:hypothetical protein